MSLSDYGAVESFDVEHWGLFSEPDPVMHQRHLFAEVMRDLDPPKADAPWVLVVAGDPIEWFATSDEAFAAGWDWHENQEPDGGNYDGALDAAIRNGVR